MRSVKHIVQFFFLLFHGCFAGLLVGQLYNLSGYQQADQWLNYSMPATGLGLAFILALCRKQIQKYLLNNLNFQWIFFSFSIVQGIVLLIFLLPLFFNLEESPLIVNAIELSTLFFILLVFSFSFILNLNLLQPTTEDLLQLKRSKPYVNFIKWLVFLLSFAVLPVLLFQSGNHSLNGILEVTLILGSTLFISDLGVKGVIFWIFTSLDRYQRWDLNPKKVEETSFFLAQKDPYFLENNLEKVILETRPEDRSLVYAKIRQMALVDKIADLEAIRNNHLPDEEELSCTLFFLKRLKNIISTTNVQYEIEGLANVLEIKACIRTVIGDGNPMLVQKLLNDSRPEVKKAAIRATVYFNEPSFIPALVNLLKDPEFAFSAQEALHKIGVQSIPYLRSAKYRNKENTFFMERCLELVEGFEGKDARDLLLEMLNEPQRRFQYKAALALLKKEHFLSSIQKTQFLQFIESLIGTIAVEREIRCKISKQANEYLVEALAAEEFEKEELVLNLIKGFIPKPIYLSVVHELKKSSFGNPYVLFALIDLFFPLLLRAKFKFLLGNGRDVNIAPGLQSEYVHEQIHFNFNNTKEAIRHILKMDYSQIGFWLRVCALKELAKAEGQQVSNQILAEIFNEIPLIQEVAAAVIYELNYDYYFLQMQRLPPERAKILRYKVESHQLLTQNNNRKETCLLYDQLLYLRSLPLFRDCSFEDLARNLHLFTMFTFEDQKKELNFDPYHSSGYWIVCQGQFSIYYRGEELLRAGEGDVVDMSFLEETEKHEVILHPETELEIFFIEYYSLNKLYLKSGGTLKFVLQPKLNHSLKLQVS